MVMGVLWARLAERDSNWRHVYKVIASYFLMTIVVLIFLTNSNLVRHQFFSDHTNHQREMKLCIVYD